MHVGRFHHLPEGRIYLVSLNIKNEHVHELARQAAQVTGKSQTGAIQEALESLLASYGADPVQSRTRHKVDAARRIAEAYRSDPGNPRPPTLNVEDLYADATGLPR